MKKSIEIIFSDDIITRSLIVDIELQLFDLIIKITINRKPRANFFFCIKSKITSQILNLKAVFFL